MQIGPFLSIIVYRYSFCESEPTYFFPYLGIFSSTFFFFLRKLILLILF